METKKYTCIKATTMRHKKITIGEEVELTDEQARPLQHGGFITFDEEAAKCIRRLAGIDESVSDDVGNKDASIETAVKSESSRQVYSTSTGFEKGD